MRSSAKLAAPSRPDQAEPPMARAWPGTLIGGHAMRSVQVLSRLALQRLLGSRLFKGDEGPGSFSRADADICETGISAISDPAISDSAISDSAISDSAISDSATSDSAISDSAVSDSAVSDS